MRARRNRGFTLIELLVVVAIIAILVAIAIPMLREAMLRAHISAAIADGKELQTAFKRFHIDNNMYLVLTRFDGPLDKLTVLSAGGHHGEPSPSLHPGIQA